MNENNKLQIENKKGNNGKMERKGENVHVSLGYIQAHCYIIQCTI